MDQSRSKSAAIISWFLPSGTEMAIYGSLMVVIFVSSNFEMFKSTFLLPDDFSLTGGILNSATNLLENFAGPNVSRAMVLSIFWAIIGLIVYAAVWIISNFTDELGNDLAATKFAHPKNIDTASPLKDFLSKSFFRLIVVIIYVYYLNILITVILGYTGTSFKKSVELWPHLQAFISFIIGLTLGLICLHLFTVFTRLLLLRKRVFG